MGGVFNATNKIGRVTYFMLFVLAKLKNIFKIGLKIYSDLKSVINLK